MIIFKFSNLVFYHKISNIAPKYFCCYIENIYMILYIQCNTYYISTSDICFITIISLFQLFQCTLIICKF